MQFSAVIFSTFAALVAAGNDGAVDDGSYVTVVDWFTTLCAEPTVVTWDDVYYTATVTNQIITVTNCPCTITTTKLVTATATGVTTKAAASAGTTVVAAAKPTYVTAGAGKQAAGVVGAIGAAVLAMV